MHQHPTWRFAFSRPGFVTFKMNGSAVESTELQLRSVFARTFGWSIGRSSGEDLSQAIQKVQHQAPGRVFDQLHVWQRDTRLPGEDGFLPGVTPLADEVGRDLFTAAQEVDGLVSAAKWNRVAKANQRVWDCILLEPDRWWLGWHTVTCFAHRWPGGVMPVRIPDDMISRAYLKTKEALAWSGWPVRPGDRCAEIGSAPGGSCQALLELGLKVTGIDPAEMHPDVLRHPQFHHVRKRGAEVRRRAFRGFKWLLVDSNVAPQHTLDTVESIVTHPTTSFQGLLLTLKLPEWQLAHEVGSYARRVRSWGFQSVRCRQLAYQRQEICLAALRHRALRRLPRRKTR
jgi:23S rRNA (cytidine2498-2'-O)-methyltransferase